MDDLRSPLEVRERAWFQRLQSLDDAIAYRRARLQAHCVDCEDDKGGEKCDDHDGDVMLLADYHKTAQAVVLEKPGPLTPGESASVN